MTEEQKELVTNTQMSAREIADILEVHPVTVARWRKKLGVTSKRGAKAGRKVPARETRFERTCKMCPTSFWTVPSRDQRFCSRSCATKHQLKQSNHLARPGLPRPWRRNKNTSEYRAYQRQVHRLTKVVYEENIDIINPERHPRTLCGVEDGWQLDHIESIRECFDQGHDPEYCARLENLQMLPWKKNLLKG